MKYFLEQYYSLLRQRRFANLHRKPICASDAAAGRRTRVIRKSYEDERESWMARYSWMNLTLYAKLYPLFRAVSLLISTLSCKSCPLIWTK